MVEKEKTERGGKFEVSLVEEHGNKKGEEQELSVWHESISSQGERWFKVELELWKRKRELERLREYERQELLRDFPNLKLGGLLPDPVPKEGGEVKYEMLE